MAAVAMFQETRAVPLVAAARAMEDALLGLDARLVSGEDAAKGVEVLSRTENICAAKRAQLASRAAECGARREAGFSRPTDWLAKHTGSSARECACPPAGRPEARTTHTEAPGSRGSPGKGGVRGWPRAPGRARTPSAPEGRLPEGRDPP